MLEMEPDYLQPVDVDPPIEVDDNLGMSLDEIQAVPLQDWETPPPRVIAIADNFEKGISTVFYDDGSAEVNGKQTQRPTLRESDPD